MFNHIEQLFAIFPLTFGILFMNRIKELLSSKGLKQIELAQTLGVAKSSVSQWCSNTVQPPVSKLIEIAQVIDCDITELLVSTKNKK